MKEEKTEKRSLEAMNREAGQASSRILELMNTKGKTTEPGPAAIPCSYDSSTRGTYRIHHPWSLYDVSFTELQKAMNRLREELPKNSWKIIKDGPDRSISKSAQIVANSRNGRFSVDIRLRDERKKGNKSSLIEVTLVSDCFQKRTGEENETG